MKIFKGSKNEAGGTLIVVLIVAGIMTAALGTYMVMAQSQSKAAARSLSWNAALPLAETGIEEGLSHLTVNKANYAADGWSKNGTVYTKQRNLGDGYYIVTVSGAPGSVATITSTGYKRLEATSNYVARTVQVTARTWTFTQVGLVAKTIGFGGNLGVDSYDSSNPLYSTNGDYIASKATALATVGTPGIGFSLGGNAHILGFAATGPGGSVSVSGSASIGDASYGGSGIQAGHALSNFTNVIADVQVPYLSATAPTNGTVSGTNYTYVLSGGKYKANALNSAGSGSTMIVTAPSTLYVTGAVTLAKIVFAPGAKLDFYVATPDLDFDPEIVGASPPQFTVWGLPSCTTMRMNAGTIFEGVIYAPQLNLQANGHASIWGAVVANDFSCNGTFDFHYDLATSITGAPKPVSILSWAEL